MRICTLSELSKKEVISCMDCSRLGFITDCEIQLENAQIVAIIVEEQSGFFNFFKRKTIRIPWECIKKIGEDLIIADYLKPIQEQIPEHKGSFLKNLFKS